MNWSHLHRPAKVLQAANSTVLPAGGVVVRQGGEAQSPRTDQGGGVRGVLIFSCKTSGTGGRGQEAGGRRPEAGGRRRKEGEGGAFFVNPFATGSQASVHSTTRGKGRLHIWSLDPL